MIFHRYIVLDNKSLIASLFVSIGSYNGSETQRKFIVDNKTPNFY